MYGFVLFNINMVLRKKVNDFELKIQLLLEPFCCCFVE